MVGGLLIAGTASDVGKSVVTAGICRWLRRRTTWSSAKRR
jgi:adenosylcobyric acid synthase